MRVLFIMMTPLMHNTSGVIRACGIIEGAKKNGNTCDVITLESEESDFAYDDSNISFINRYVDNYYQIKKSSSYTRVRQKKKTNKLIVLLRSYVKSIYRMFHVYDPQIMNVQGILSLDVDFNSYDRIVSISDPKSSHKLVLALIEKGKIVHSQNKWIQCWGDPWLYDMTQHFGINRMLVRREEEKILSLANKVVYTSPFTLNLQQNKYKNQADKMICVNQTAVEQNNAFHSETGKEFSLGYFGAYNKKIRNIVPLYNCCKRNGFKLTVVGGLGEELQETSTIRILNRMSKREADLIISRVSVIVCLCNRSGTQIPGKIYYEAGCNKPIIVIVDGEQKNEMRTYFDSFERYIICENDEDSIKDAITKAKSEIASGRKYILGEKFKDSFAAARILDKL